MKILNFLVLLSMFTLSFGFSPISSLSSSSLEWQKIELEKSIKNEIISVVSPVIKSGEYVINVNVKIKKTSPLRPPSGAGGEPGKSPKKSEIRFNDIDPKDAKGDYIVMSKLGLEAPVYEDDPGANQKDNKQEKSEAKEWQKFLTDYINTYDLFKSIESVTLNVKLDNFLGEDTKKTVEELLNGMKLQFGEIQPKLEISYIDMKEIKKELDKKKLNEKREFYEWMGKLGQPIGIVVAAILLGIFGLLLFKKYAELHAKQMEMMKEQIAQKDASKSPVEEEKADDSKKDSNLGGELLQGEAPKEDGVERFKAMLLNNPVDSCLMIKRWIKETTKVNQLVLNLLVKELSADELTTVFQNITMDERKNWKKFINRPLKADEIITAKRYLASQVVQEMIIPNTITDAQVVELLIRINPEESALFCQEDAKLASILMNVMNAKFLTKMMDNLDEVVINELINESLQLTTEKINSLIPAFKEKILAHVKIETVSPMVEKLVELIPLSSPSRERTLYLGLAHHAKAEKIFDLAKNNFPSELIFKVPDASMKQLTQSYPREKRPELVLILDESMKNNFIQIIAPNEKSKDMLNLDLEKYSRDEALMKKVTDNKDQIMRDFIDHCRKQIKANPQLVKELTPLLSGWIQELVPSESNESNLAAAA